MEIIGEIKINMIFSFKFRMLNGLAPMQIEECVSCFGILIWRDCYAPLQMISNQIHLVSFSSSRKDLPSCSEPGDAEGELFATSVILRAAASAKLRCGTFAPGAG